VVRNCRREIASDIDATRDIRTSPVNEFAPSHGVV
jgi:hypothetical protein